MSELSERREQVARINDPDAWRSWDRDPGPHRASGALHAIRATLEKADAIEALYSQALADERRLRLAAEDRVARHQNALLSLVRGENSCLGHVKDPARCTGWDAERCGCAIEARSLLPLGGEQGEDQGSSATDVATSPDGLTYTQNPAGNSARVSAAADALISAYRLKYLTGKGIRANAPLRREIGELKIALGAAEPIWAVHPDDLEDPNAGVAR